MARRTGSTPKRVVYLWGAGATHAEAQRLGGTISLLMRDSEIAGEGITTRILRRMGREIVSSFSGEEAGNVDIEKLITLLSGSGNKIHTDLAEKLRQNYFAVLKASLSEAGIMDRAELATQLFEMHNNPAFQEEIEVLAGVITTNHDGLLQLVSQQVHGAINPGIRFQSLDFKYSSSAPLIIQLHGSFGWRFGMPTKIAKLRKNSQYNDTLWIPPTILKESKNYPYNKLSGMAYELLTRRCDLLRVIGTSLTQNDWNVLSLIFNAQRHREITTKREPFVIDLIMPHDAGEGIKKECAYLKNVRSIGYLTEGQFADYKEPEKVRANSDLGNPFFYWLTQKLEFHRSVLRARPTVLPTEAQTGASA